MVETVSPAVKQAPQATGSVMPAGHQPHRATGGHAALLGHRTMEMRLINAHRHRVVAAYQAVSPKIDALYGQPPGLPLCLMAGATHG